MMNLEEKIRKRETSEGNNNKELKKRKGNETEETYRSR